MEIIKYLRKSVPNVIKYNLKYIYKRIQLRFYKRWDAEKINIYQVKKVNKVISTFNFCHDKNYNQINDINEIEHIDITSKHNYSNENAFKKSRGIGLYCSNTGGTTGKPLKLIKSRNDLAFEAAFIDDIIHDFDVNTFIPYKAVRLRGDNIDSWIKSTGYNKYSLSSYKINENTVKYYYDFLKSFSPDVIFCYPSSLYLLSKEIISKTDDFDKIKCKVIVFSSENLFDYQLELIKRVFDSNVINLYGNTEHSVLAVDYCQGSGFIFNSLYSHVSFKNKKIISTSFNDLNMPMLRYDTDDLVDVDNLGRLKILGRNQDIAIGVSGQNYPVVGLFFGQHFTFFNEVKEMQLVQNKAGQLSIHYYSEKILSESSMLQAQEKVRKLSNNDLDVSFEYKSSPLCRTKSGKLKFFVKDIL
ncbi:hypothetical protein P0Y67_04010 [Photobacterium sp. SP02]|uniref:hypothetical protein n=1 Tax=Photobacterium sp. SP02 TaxID=3032280 RepID=UPI0031452EBC